MGRGSVIVADTHAWLWWLSTKESLSSTARQRLDFEDVVGVSMISLLEISTAVTRGRIELDMPLRPWIASALQRTRTILLPIEIDIAVEAGSMTSGVGDPADRLIVATALHHRAPLVTRDGRIRESGLVETIW